MRVYKTATAALMLLLNGGGVADAFSAKLAKRYAAIHRTKSLTKSENRFGSGATTSEGRDSKDHQSSSTELEASTSESEVAEADSQHQEDTKEEAPTVKASIDATHVFVASTSGATRVVADTSVTSTSPTATKPTPTVLSCWKDLLGMTRPSNFMGVVIFHLLGTYLATAASNTGDLSFVSTLLKPSMCVVLVVLLLTSSTSMLVNDYYDARLGVDATKAHAKPLVTGQVPMAVAKQALNYLYAVTLLGAVIVPGIPARMSVVVGLMLTFWYTKHLKPITWLKNVVCACLIAFAPLTSGSAAIALQRGATVISPNAIMQVATLPASLIRCVSMLFFGFLGREIMMDINDTEDDRLHRVRTVPVKYGRRFASGVALASTSIMSVLVLIGPILGGINWRRLIFAVLGAGAMMKRVVDVVRTEGHDKDIVNKAIEEGHLTMMLLLASFI
eukprot:CAMPEP_0194035756 /NCGR_PEP_ID=MMETSP0009_2-20130614/8173_1 /TAXON_ID=210454 /ORGANISM="Grammatophora oceanica, Strain CCMP 410" /LENGTH=445 /DNA_ID=CAMNT_0038677241 /DNA_START=164 /DNA_END=1501 /DNA_ORIENTATION=-